MAEIIATRAGEWITVSFKEGVKPDLENMPVENTDPGALTMAPSLTINDQISENHPVSFEQLAVIYIQDDEEAHALSGKILVTETCEFEGANGRGKIRCYLANRHLLKLQAEIYLRQ